MIERRIPTRTSVVAGRTVRGEPGGGVVRIGRAVEIRHMAGGTHR